ncbi:TPA: hypothetical protein JWI84_003069 [Escherichia coli]|nr:hypothetical protein [Escherichia coli]
MKKTIAAIVVSVCVGAVGGFACGYDYSDTKHQETITTTNTTINNLNKEIDTLKDDVNGITRMYKDVMAEKSQYQQDKNNLVIYGIGLCKKMKDERGCLMELALKGNAPFDFKD